MKTTTFSLRKYTCVPKFRALGTQKVLFPSLKIFNYCNKWMGSWLRWCGGVMPFISSKNVLGQLFDQPDFIIGSPANK